MKLLIAIVLLLFCCFATALCVLYAIQKPRQPLRVLLFVLFALPLLCGMTVTSLGVKNLADPQLQAMSGSYRCSEHPVEDQERYTGFLQLVIGETGHFSMVDVEAGNPGIKGVMIRMGKEKLLLLCTDKADFDPPPGWNTMRSVQMITFETDEKGTLMLRYQGEQASATLLFSPE